MKNLNKRILLILMAVIFSGSYNFVNAQLVAPPVNLLPAHQQQNTSMTPTLEWGHPLSALATFRVQVATDVSFNANTIVLDQGGINGLTDYTVPVGILNQTTTYYWRANATVLVGITLLTSEYSVPTSFTTTVMTNLTQNGGSIPDEYRLHRNYPNPFNPSTTIKFDVKEQGFVSLKVYNMIGQEVADLVNNNLAAGSYETVFEAGKLSSGVYIVKYTINDFIASSKIALNK